MGQEFTFGKHLIEIDPAAETDRIVSFLQNSVHKTLRRYGGVVGVSGGLDSSVVLALCAQAFSPDRVTAIIMPEKESDSDSEKLAFKAAEHSGVEAVLEEITQALEGFRCYSRRDDCIRRIFPEFSSEAGYKAKIILPGNLLEHETLNFFSLVVLDPKGQEFTHRLSAEELRAIVAASNFKQRSRMAMLYHHAELRNYAVIGTANKNEHELGFFVKYGDGGVDVMPIAHLFKTQIYQLAEYLNIPDVIRERTPSTDTYSAGGSQQEFFFRLPFEILDVIWMGYENDISRIDIAEALNLSIEQVDRVIDDITRKQRTTEYLRLHPFGLSSVLEVN
jgi:NAD+ synthase